MRNIVLGLAVAAALGLSASGASVRGVEAWKIVAAAAGAALFLTAGRSSGRA